MFAGSLSCRRTCRDKNSCGSVRHSARVLSYCRIESKCDRALISWQAVSPSSTVKERKISPDSGSTGFYPGADAASCPGGLHPEAAPACTFQKAHHYRIRRSGCRHPAPWQAKGATSLKKARKIASREFSCRVRPLLLFKRILPKLRELATDCKTRDTGNRNTRNCRCVHCVFVAANAVNAPTVPRRAMIKHIS